MIRCGFQLIQAGSCLHPAAMARRGASFRPQDFPALAGLVLHPSEGAVLFDTGYDPAFNEATRSFPERLYRWATPVTLASDGSVAAQLPRFGLKPEDIRTVVVSHFHGDHIAGLHAFPKADVYCARAGLTHARSGGRLSRVRQGVLSGLIPPSVDAKARFFEDLPRRPLGRDFAPFEDGADIFGDGALLAVELPGHCPGHWGLVFEGEEGRPTFLIGDAAWSLGAVRDNVPPPALTTSLLGRTDVYRETLSGLHRLQARNTDIRLTPSHCPEAAAGYRYEL